jgi:hypothetical protein
MRWVVLRSLPKIDTLRELGYAGQELHIPSVEFDQVFMDRLILGIIGMLRLALDLLLIAGEE